MRMLSLAETITTALDGLKKGVKQLEIFCSVNCFGYTKCSTHQKYCVIFPQDWNQIL
jgi:hypothetical protein